MRAVQPSSDVALASAPFFNNDFTTCPSPRFAANMSGVTPAVARENEAALFSELLLIEFLLSILCDDPSGRVLKNLADILPVMSAVVVRSLMAPDSAETMFLEIVAPGYGSTYISIALERSFRLKYPLRGKVIGCCSNL